jgi:hypothetical protein
MKSQFARIAKAHATAQSQREKRPCTAADALLLQQGFLHMINCFFLNGSLSKSHKIKEFRRKRIAKPVEIEEIFKKNNPPLKFREKPATTTTTTTQNKKHLFCCKSFFTAFLPASHTCSHKKIFTSNPRTHPPIHARRKTEKTKGLERERIQREHNPI